MAKNPFYGILTPIIVVAATVGLFFLLKPETVTAIFWINLAYSVLLEVLFFGWYFHRNENQTSMFGTIFGTNMMMYIGVSLVIIAGFSIGNLFIEGDNTCLLKWYGATAIVLTLLWFLTTVFLGKNDAAYHEQQTKLETKTQDIRILTKQLKQIAEEKATEETQQDWNALIRAFSGIPPARINASNYNVLEEIVQEAQSADPSAVPFRQLINRIKLI